MKKGKKYILHAVLCIGLLFSIVSCVVFPNHNHANYTNGTPKGWNKNTNNPHNPNTTNPGKAKGNSGKDKGKPHK